MQKQTSMRSSHQCLPALAVLVFACFAFLPGALRAEEGITIITPTDGQTITPGSEVSIVVEVAPQLNPEAVHVWPSMPSGIPALKLSNPPYQGVLQIPADLTGPVKIDVWVESNSGIAASKLITMNVVPSVAPIALDELHNSDVSLRFPTTDGRESDTLSVEGVYADGERRDLTGASLGTTYTSSDPSVVTVDANGVLVVTGSGNAVITLENSGVRTFVGVDVDGPNGESPPPVDIMNKVRITKSGFRRDPATGFFAQELSFRNDSSLPLSRPFGAVLSGMPEGVELKNRSGKTTGVTPQGDAYINVFDFEGKHLAPGQSAKVVLKFSNSEGAPITYDIKIYSGFGL